MNKYQAALFDLDGVVFDTEPQYTIFWRSMCEKYRPDIPELWNKFKGQTLVQIFDQYFGGMSQIQAEIVEALNAYEKGMKYQYVIGFEEFITDLRANGLKTAAVTSSNQEKMRNVYRSHPEFQQLFDRILTSEDFSASKPDPDCYLKGAAVFGLRPDQCIGFEDSFNGLKAVRAAHMPVIGLATTNSQEAIQSYCDVVLDDYQGVNLQKIVASITPIQ